MNDLYTVYSAEGDMTFIMCDTYRDDEFESTECVGWYFGESDPELTKQYTGCLKAHYDTKGIFDDGGAT